MKTLKFTNTVGSRFYNTLYLRLAPIHGKRLAGSYIIIHTIKISGYSLNKIKAPCNEIAICSISTHAKTIYIMVQCTVK
jgi:hypothetical protein